MNLLRSFIALIAALSCVSCQSSYTAVNVVMNKRECGGAFGMGLTFEQVPEIGEVFFVKKDNSRPKPVKVNDKGLLVLKGRRGRAEVFISEKISTKLEMQGPQCEQWRKTPDFVVLLKKGKHTQAVVIDVMCNPCLRPAP